ncbi:MAG: type II/IV secretion system protein [Verrucomicrobia bacterium]|nr:type II/IV secretion system protein [Verrucomicrobiota bacterium]
MNHAQAYLQSDETAKHGVDVPNLLQLVFQDAIESGASDVHIEPWEDSIAIRLRINGVLKELVHVASEHMDKISGRCKVMGEMVTYQSGLPQEGHSRLGPELGNVELRISVFPTTRGEKIVVRLFDPRNRSFDLNNLGFDSTTLGKFVQMLGRTSGLLLLTGPTGSGKTTAIYSALTHLINLHGSSISVSTVEDPVEFNLPLVAQTQINPAQEFSYARALRSLMRQDPQVIMVGEIRDPETAAIAVQAGLTGHLVISTIHSGTPAGVFARLINMDIEPFLLASSIIGVLGVRLLRLNCKNCALPCDVEPGYLQILPQEVISGANFMRSPGCEQCLFTGYSGRSSLSELIAVDEPIREAVIMKTPTRSITKIAIDNGMTTMWQKGIKKVLTGETTFEEVYRVVASEQI